MALAVNRLQRPGHRATFLRQLQTSLARVMLIFRVVAAVLWFCGLSVNLRDVSSFDEHVYTQFLKSRCRTAVVTLAVLNPAEVGSTSQFDLIPGRLALLFHLLFHLFHLRKRLLRHFVLG